MRTVLDRFLSYIARETTSLPDQETVPSTPMQMEFAKFLVKEMQEIGITDAEVDEHGYVFGTVPATVENAPVIGYIAHMDTVNDMPNKDIKPAIVHYEGGDILLNKELGIKMSPEVFPHMNDYIGHDLVVTDGTTILGADDKAGIAEILVMAERMIKDPSIPHGKIRIGFTPDEEVGRGADFFDVKRFGADFGYTVDGGALGGMEYENFNAATVKITVHGENIHPGASKDKMKNAILVGMELHRMLPVQQRPEFTDWYDGFFHITSFEGTVETAKMGIIIRDHDRAKFSDKKAKITAVAEYLNGFYGEGTVEITITDSYFNMKEVVEPHMFLVDNAKEAFLELGVTPVISPIRGGTDGSRLSYMGLPCPNLSTGGHNAHGKYEYVSVQSMEKMVDLLEILAKKFVK